MSNSIRKLKLVMVGLMLAIFFGTVIANGVTAQSLEEELRTGSTSIEEAFSALIAQGLPPELAASTIMTSAMSAGMSISVVGQRIMAAAITTAVNSGQDIDGMVQAVSKGIISGAVDGASNSGMDPQTAANSAGSGIGTGIQAAAQAMNLYAGDEDSLRNVAKTAAGDAAEAEGLDRSQVEQAIDTAPAPTTTTEEPVTTTGFTTTTTTSTTTSTTSTTTHYGG